MTQEKPGQSQIRYAPSTSPRCARTGEASLAPTALMPVGARFTRGRYSRWKKPGQIEFRRAVRAAALRAAGRTQAPPLRKRCGIIWDRGRRFAWLGPGATRPWRSSSRRLRPHPVSLRGGLR